MIRHIHAHRNATVRTALYVARGGYGALQLACPTLVSGRLLRADLDGRSRAVARMLGARQLTQAVASGPVPSYPVLAVGIEVDVLHTVSMLALALTGRRRRATFTDALIAAAFVLAGALAAREAGHGPPPQPGNAVQKFRQKWADRVATACVPRYPARSGTSQVHGRAHDPWSRGTTLPPGPIQKRK